MKFSRGFRSVDPVKTLTKDSAKNKITVKNYALLNISFLRSGLVYKIFYLFAYEI